MARILAAAAAVLLCCAALAAANDGCTDAIIGYSGTYGKRNTAKLERFANQTSQWLAKGAITKFNAYYNATAQCVQGVKMTYGYVSTDARLLGAESGLLERSLKLATGEHFNKAQVKAGATCIEYIRLVTNLGNAVTVGNAASTSQLYTSNPSKATGFLAAVRGYEQYAKGAGTATVRGPMETLQFVWANCNPTTAVAAVLPSPVASSPKPSPSPSPPASPAKPSPSPAPSPPKPSPAASTASGSPSASTASSATQKQPSFPSCPAVTTLCATTADTASAAYCPFSAPFIRSACVGGCCFSSGKCPSSGCAISGVGKEVANTICYGLNPAGAVGASPACQGLACQLAVPGCTSDMLGGSCVGTVIDAYGTLLTANPSAAAFVGMPCLDVTASTTTIDGTGAASAIGEFVSGLWSICDCNSLVPAPTDTTAAATGAAASSSGTGSTLSTLSSLNFTSIVDLVNSVEDGKNAAVQAALAILKSKVPHLVLPKISLANLTSTISFLGSLVKGGSTASGGASNIVNFAKGAASLAAATNSSNPLGSLLGAFAAKASNGTTDPLAGLSNLVSALSGSGADTTEKADVLSRILAALSSGTGAAPAADLISSVSQVLTAAGADSPATAFKALAADIKAGTNVTSLMTAVKAAINEGQAAANGMVGLNNIFSKLQSFFGGSSGSSGTSSGGSLGIGSILSGVKALASGNATAAAANPVALLTSLVQDTSDGSLSLAEMVDLATKAAPLLSSLSGAGAANASCPAGLLKDALSTLGGGGIDFGALTNVMTKVSPLLTALGGGSSTATTNATSTAAAGSKNLFTSFLSKLGFATPSSGTTSTTGSSGLSLSSLGTLLSTAQKAAPVLESLSALGKSNSTLLTGIQSFLNIL